MNLVMQTSDLGSLVCWGQLLNGLWEPIVYLFPTLYSMTSCWQLEFGFHGNIYTTRNWQMLSFGTLIFVLVFRKSIYQHVTAWEHPPWQSFFFSNFFFLQICQVFKDFNLSHVCLTLLFRYIHLSSRIITEIISS